ncbi:MAG: nucleotidyltransferase domain-containing protein [Chloroflexi bacterium]|nr:nucleotidyltransferase domain-containing protein [Chloroflexota bacterium]
MTQEAVTAARTLAGACADALRVARRSPTVAAYLHGSLVLGDFVPGRSDIDLLVVVDVRLADGELAAVQAAGTAWCAEGRYPIDLRLVTRSQASRPTRP